MKKLILLMISCLFLAYQAGAQEKAVVRTSAANKAAVTTSGGKTATQAVMVKSAAQVTSNVAIQPVSILSSGTGSAAPAAAKSADSDFPKYINTGDPQKDMETYEKAKDEWIQKNPEKYKAMQGLK